MASDVAGPVDVIEPQPDQPDAGARPGLELDRRPAIGESEQGIGEPREIGLECVAVAVVGAETVGIATNRMRSPTLRFRRYPHTIVSPEPVPQRPIRGSNRKPLRSARIRRP
jgi:hypothetical protein